MGKALTTGVFAVLLLWGVGSGVAHPARRLQFHRNAWDGQVDLIGIALLALIERIEGGEALPAVPTPPCVPYRNRGMPGRGRRPTACACACNLSVSRCRFLRRFRRKPDTSHRSGNRNRNRRRASRRRRPGLWRHHCRPWPWASFARVPILSLAFWSSSSSSPLRKTVVTRNRTRLSWPSTAEKRSTRDFCESALSRRLR